MLGFLTIVAFVIAWKAGGWWWLIAIVMGLVWGGKQEEKKKAAAAVNQPDVAAETNSTPTSTAPTGDARNQTEQLSNANDRVIQITEICARYSGADFYVAELIPQKKLDSAMASYPVPGGGRVVALIDSTVMGSADNGMAIGEYGISWHNDWTTDSKKTSFRWEEMKDISIRKDGLFNIEIGDGNMFNMSGSQFGKDQLINLLGEVKALSARAVTSTTTSRSQHPTATKPAVVDVNLANFDQLISLPGIGAAEAKMILNRRASHPFSSVNDLADYLDLKPHKADQMKNFVIFSASDWQHSTKTPESPPAIIQAPDHDAPPPVVAKPVTSTGGRMID